MASEKGKPNLDDLRRIVSQRRNSLINCKRTFDEILKDEEESEKRLEKMTKIHEKILEEEKQRNMLMAEFAQIEQEHSQMMKECSVARKRKDGVERAELEMEATLEKTVKRVCNNVFWSNCFSSQTHPCIICCSYCFQTGVEIEADGSFTWPKVQFVSGKNVILFC